MATTELIETIQCILTEMRRLSLHLENLTTDTFDMGIDCGLTRVKNAMITRFRTLDRNLKNEIDKLEELDQLYILAGMRY